MTGFGDAFSRIAAAMSGEGDARGDWPDTSADLIAEIQAEQEVDYLRKLAKWKATEPQRRRAEVAWRAAAERRQAELGLGDAGRGRVFAAYPFAPPEPPPHMR
jgi:hypothetical protein